MSGETAWKNELLAIRHRDSPVRVQIRGAMVRADGVSLAEAEAIAARVALLLKGRHPCGDVKGCRHIAHEMLEPRQRQRRRK